MMMSPEVLVSIPPKILRIVDLPAPEAPKIIANSPFSMEKLTSLLAKISVSPVW